MTGAAPPPADAERVRVGFVFGARDRTGIAMGWRVGQVAVVAVGVALAVLLGGRGRLGPAVIVLVLAVVAAVLTAGDRGLDEWAPVVTRFVARRLAGADRWVDRRPLLGGAIDRRGRAAQPDCLRGLELLDAPADTGPGRVGVVKDGSVFSVLVEVRGRPFALVDGVEQDQRVQRWGQVLAGLGGATGSLHRLQWVVRIVPDDGDTQARYVAEQRAVAADHPWARAYDELRAELRQSASRHETTVVVSVSHASAGRAIAQAGGGDAGACRVLLHEAEQVAVRLTAAGLEVVGVLDPRMVALRLREAVDPPTRDVLARRQRALAPDDEGDGAASPTEAWPLAVEEHWDHVRTDSARHVTWWVAEWPRQPVTADFLGRMVGAAQHIRTVSLVAQPVDRARATRDAEAARAGYVADEQLRDRHGFVPTQRRRAQLSAIERREQELADGHAELRFSAYVTVTVPTGDPTGPDCTGTDRTDANSRTGVTNRAADVLADAIAEVTGDAVDCRLDLRRLYGETARGLVATLPVGRGLQ